MIPRILLALLAVLPAAAAALCTSDEVPQAAALLERFTSADCLECWRDPATPRAGDSTIALDWIVPGRAGEQATMAAIASDDALQRLAFLRRATPRRSDAVRTPRVGQAPALRLAQGDAFNDYVGTSIELKAPGRERWHAWLMLVEQLPAGIEGSPVPRNIVRNVFRPEWSSAAGRDPRLLVETRAMQIHEGARPSRLRLVAVLQDGRGRIRAITQTGCRE